MAPALAATGDWPQFRDGPSHQGYNAQESTLSVGNVNRLKTAWIGASSGLYMTSSPAIADGVVYVGAYDHKLYAYAVGCNSGGGSCTPLWTGTTGGGVHSSPAVVDGVVYVGSADGTLYAFAVGCNSGGGSCSPLWTGATSGAIVSSPVVADGVAYVGSWDGKLYAFAVGCNSGGGACTPLWTGSTGDLITSSPAVGDGVVYVGSNDYKLYAFAVGCNTGGGSCSPLWTGATEGTDWITSSPAVANGVVYVGSINYKLYAFAVGCNTAGGSCTPLWTGKTGSAIRSSPAVANGVVYVGSGDGKLSAYAVGCNNGGGSCSPLWTGATGDQMDTSPAVANGVVYVGSDDGKLYAFAVGCNTGGGTCRALWSGTTGGGVESSPAVADGVVYVGSDDGKLYAFGLTGPVDSTPPAATLSLNSAALSTTSTAVNGQITASDDASGVASYRLSNDGTTWSAWSDWPASAASFSVNWTLPAGDGTHAVFAEVRDAATNVSLPASSAIDLDTSVASDDYGISIDAGSDFTNSRGVLLSLPALPGTVAMEVSNDGGFAGATWEPYASHRAWTLGNPHGVIVTKSVYVKFKAGDGSLATRSDDIVIDPTAPTSASGSSTAIVPTMSHAAPAPTSLKTSTLNTSATDQTGGSGVAQMELSASSTFASAVWQPYAPSAKWTYDTHQKVTVYYRFMDGAGNVSTRYHKTLANPTTASIPTQVAPVSGATISSRRPAFNWLALSGGPSYQLEVSASSSFATTLLNRTTKKLSLKPTSSLPAGTVYWRVRRTGGAWSPTWAVTVPASDPPKLTSPAGQASLTTLSPKLSWAAVSGATSYQLQLAPDASFLTGVQSFTSGPTHLQLVPLARRASYAWRVRAKVAGVFGPWSAGRSFITPAIDRVNLLSPADGGHLGSLPALLDWSDVTGALSYHIQVCSNSSCSTTVRDTSVANSLYQLKTPLATGTYWWRVQAIGTRSVSGAWSSVRHFVR